MAVLWRIDSLSQQEIEKYRQRSARAINGLRMCLKYADAISKYEKIGDKYKTLANYMGLAQEGGNSYYNYFIPLNEDLVFMLRNANHDNANVGSYNRHEQLGRPNKRFVIYFKNGSTFKDNKMIFLDAEHHIVPYNVNALDNETSVTAYINSLINLFENGETTFPSLPIIAENKQYKSHKKMKYTIKESQLHKIIAESVKKVLSELDARTYASYADKRAKQADVEKYLGNDDKADSLYKKAHQGKQAAVKAFNDQYGYDEQYPVDANGRTVNGLNSRRYQMDAGSGDKNYPYRAYTYNAELNPKYAHGQTINFGKDGKDVVSHRNGSFGDNYEEFQDNNIWHPYDAIGREQTRVAKQMAQGNGKYIKGKGWQ